MLRGNVCTKILAYFGHSSRVCFGGTPPKLVEWVSFWNFKVNLVKKLYHSETNTLPNNVNEGEFVKGCST